MIQIVLKYYFDQYFNSHEMRRYIFIQQERKILHIQFVTAGLLKALQSSKRGVYVLIFVTLSFKINQEDHKGILVLLFLS